MTDFLTLQEGTDIVTVQRIASQFHAEVVVIGAFALLCLQGDIGRFTHDIDLVVALDLDDFTHLTALLQGAGWVQAEKEHRWRSPTATLVDLLPAGPGLRSAKKILWPRSELTMSLVGFDHVFSRCIEIELSPGIRCKVAPLPVIALLKITAYLDDRQRRRKDLDDLNLLLRTYAHNTDRIFSDEVFDAQLEDIDLTSAFLLGFDIKTFAAPDELQLIDQFLAGQESSLFDDEKGIRLRRQLGAFRTGLGIASSGARP